MQHYRLDGTANIILRHKGALAPGQFVAFTDHEGRAILLLACRSRQVRGRKVLELLLNSVRSDGSWCEELSSEVSEHALAEGLELRFLSWRVEVFVGRSLQFACNPSASFGKGADPALATRVQTNCAGGAISLQTGAGIALPLREADVQDITLVLLHSGEPERLRAQFSSLAYRFSEICIVNPRAHFSKAKAVERPPEAVINDALAAVTTPYVALISGDWNVRDLAHPINQFLATQVAYSMMPLNLGRVARLGEHWGLLLPSRISGRCSTSVRNGILIIDAELSGTAHWMISRLETSGEGLRHLQRANAILSREWGAEGEIGVPGRRLIAQVYAHIPNYQGEILPYSGLRIDSQRLTTLLSPRRILTPLCLAVEDSCSSVFMLWDPSVGTPRRAVAWLRLSMLSEIAVVQDETGNFVALMLSRDALGASGSALAAFDALDREAYNTPCPDLSGAIAAFLDMAKQLEITVVYHQLTELDAQPDAEAFAGQSWISGSETVFARLTAALPQGRLPEAVAIARTEVEDFDALALQALSHGMIWELCQYVIALDLVIPDAQLIPRLVDLLQSSGWAREPALLATFMEALIARNYHQKITPLLPLLIKQAPDPSDVVPPDLWLRHKVVDVLMRCRMPEDTSYIDIESMRLPPEGTVPLNKGVVAYFLDSLSFYLALRGNWAAIVDLISGASLPENMAHGFYERWLRARIETGDVEGLEAELASLLASGRISGWSAHRLGLRLAQASQDAAAAAAALQTLLQNEDDMRALLQPASRFSRLGLVASDLPSEAATLVQTIPPTVLPSALPATAVPVSGSARTALPSLDAPASAVATVKPQPIIVGQDEIACIIVARNEFSRLKWLHSYYRQLGVDRFFLIDNLSDDDTIAYFARQPDVTILQTSENYRDSRYGVKWHNEVSDAYLEGRWVLTVDADEALVFAGCETPGALRDLCARLDAEGSEGFFAPLIDMYSAERLDQTPYTPGESLIERFPMFDGTGYHFDPTPGTPGTTVSGGVRIRLFWSNRHDKEVPHLAMQKVPLVRWRKGFCYLASTHDMTPLKVSGETGALLHYKFMPDFHERAMEEVRRNQHYEGAREYRIYADILKDPANRSFVHEGSVRYEGPETLANLGLITLPKGGKLSTKASTAWLATQRKLKPVEIPETMVVDVLEEGSALDFAAPAPQGRVAANVTGSLIKAKSRN